MFAQQNKQVFRVIGKLVEREFIDVYTLQETKSNGAENHIRAITYHKSFWRIYEYSTASYMFILSKQTAPTEEF